MNKKHEMNLVNYLSYLPLAGSIVANIISIVIYFLEKKSFSFESIARPILYFVIFSTIGIIIGRYLSKDFQVKGKKLTILFIIIFIIINMSKYLNII